MKKFVMACCLFTAIVAGVSNNTYAQSSYTSVTVTAFTARVNQLDSLIGAGSMTLAQTTWNDVHAMLMAELATTKANIASATSTSARTTYTTTMGTQYSLYDQIWALKSNLATNRAALHTKLMSFAATF